MGADVCKYDATACVNPKVVPSRKTGKDEYYVEASTQAVRNAHSFRAHIDGGKYATESPGPLVKSTARTVPNATKNQYTVDARKVMPAISKQSDTRSENKSTMSTSPQTEKTPRAP